MKNLRVWTLYKGEKKSGIVSGPGMHKNEFIEVVEKAPVDAERERMLDLLECWFAKRPVRRSDLGGHDLDVATEALLLEHNR